MAISTSKCLNKSTANTIATAPTVLVKILATAVPSQHVLAQTLLPMNAPAKLASVKHASAKQHSKKNNF
ncbi:hypothetical protein AO441_001972 [Nakaseomyces glabratus]|uniref:Uncharacterized protein n=1 Tax=Candida glabrata TaxID=5478 RepID=A0A0W0C869_CANGB|nr:hypothetical protein AO441_001972 [Nakaseomyces glabratus]KTB03131.1 hypothetical protein AO439_002151 [Nakaseomyces glabratus]KTB03354.1 hypothetical protein AO440_002074 [Nakaseomyces glabratus]KTB20968.1 hypothetical protein AO438_002155 [Nakaseomyces glabratus]